MDYERVKLLIREGEGLTVEFKEKYTSRIDEDIVAFANSNYSVRITRDRDDNNNKKKKNDDIIDPFRVISETRYGRKGVFKLKEYEGHLFFDFFVNRVVRVGGVDGKVK